MIYTGKGEPEMLGRGPEASCARISHLVVNMQELALRRKASKSA